MRISWWKLLPFVFISVVSLLAIFQLRQKNDLHPGKVVQIGINYLTKDSLLVADEMHHFDQIIKLAGPNPTIRSDVSALPGYHFLIATIIRLIGQIGLIGNTAFTARLISLFISLLLIPAVYLVARKLDKKNAYLKTLQVCFFPLFFPFYFLLYNDMLSLTLIIFTFYLTLERRYYLAGLLNLISLPIRQNNIIWLPFFVFLMVVQENGGKISYLGVLSNIKKGLVYYLSLLAFGIFVYLNGGVSLGEKNMHSVTITQFSNFYFFLFTFLVTLLPLHVMNMSRVIQMLNKRRVVIAGILLGFIFYLFTFKVTHPYNHIPNFIRNDLLLFFVSDFWLKTIFFLFICFALLSLINVKLIANRYYAFYIIGLLSILSSSLIEVRYYFIPLAFFLLLRKNEPKKVEYAILIFFILMALAMVKITVDGRYFI